MHILITGGTGSLGHEIVRQLLPKETFPGSRVNSVQKIIVYSRDEQKQEAMADLFKHDSRLRFFLGDVRDKDRLKLALRGVDTVIHAAALKIVPALEYNPMEALKTNIIGTQNLIEAVYENDVPIRILALSTDKAVSPVNLYGASKLCLEKLILAGNNIDPGHYRFSVVRYGNVALSRGSVIPKFIEAVVSGNRLNVTDERMTRFWITLPEAAKFVLDRLEDMQGGEVFIPKMASFRVIDLAKLVDGIWAVSGIRPGEKVHETIISEDECANGQSHGDYYCLSNLCGGGIPLTGAVGSANYIMSLDDLAGKLRSVGAIK